MSILRYQGQRLHVKTYGGAFFVLELELDKRGLRGQVEAVEFDIAAGDSNRFNRLIDGLRPDCLYLYLLFVTQKCGDGSGDGIGPGISRDTQRFDDVPLSLRSFSCKLFS